MGRPPEPDVGVIHATTLSMEPLTGAMAEVFPEARLRHVLDDALLTELQEAGRLTERLEARMRRLFEHLVVDGVSAIQLACSGFAPVVDAARPHLPVPVLKPDEAMYSELVDAGHGRVGIAATVRPALELAEQQVRALAAARGRDLAVVTACRPEGMDAAQRGDATGLEAAVLDAAEELVAAGAESIALAQYSLSGLGEVVALRTGVPVLTGPHTAARHLRTLLAP